MSKFTSAANAPTNSGKELTLDLSSIASGGIVQTTGNVVVKLVGAITTKTFDVNVPNADVKDETTGGTINVIDAANSSYYYSGTSAIHFNDNNGRFVNQKSTTVNLTIAPGTTVSLVGKFGTVTTSGNGATVILADGVTINETVGTIVDKDGKKVVTEKNKEENAELLTLATGLVEEFESFVDSVDETLLLVSDGDLRQSVSAKFTPASNAVQKLSGENKTKLSERLDTANNIVIATSFIATLQAVTVDLSDQDKILKANIKLTSAKGSVNALVDGEIKTALSNLVTVEENKLSNAVLATDALKEAILALDNLKKVGSGYNVGNFTKAQSNAVQKQLDDVNTIINNLTIEETKTALQTEKEKTQSLLTELVNSRYVYYEIIENESTSFVLKLKLSASFFQANSPRTQNNNALYLNNDGETNKVRLSYVNNPLMIPVKGDTGTFNMRFNEGYKNIDMTFTNHWDGEWEIVSDWLVEK